VTTVTHRPALLVLVFAALSGACVEGITTSGPTVDLPPPTAPKTAAAHCDAIAGMSTCLEYGDRASADADCNSFDGKVGDGPCPTGGLVGTCVHDGKNRKYYDSGGNPSDADYAGKHCRNALAGVFTP
jgi:hypothetical protein